MRADWRWPKPLQCMAIRNLRNFPTVSHYHDAQHQHNDLRCFSSFTERRPPGLGIQTTSSQVPSTMPFLRRDPPRQAGARQRTPAVELDAPIAPNDLWHYGLQRGDKLDKTFFCSSWAGVLAASLHLQAAARCPSLRLFYCCQCSRCAYGEVK